MKFNEDLERNPPHNLKIEMEKQRFFLKKVAAFLNEAGLLSKQKISVKLKKMIKSLDRKFLLHLLKIIMRKKPEMKNKKIYIYQKKTE